MLKTPLHLISRNSAANGSDWQACKHDVLTCDDEHHQTTTLSWKALPISLRAALENAGWQSLQDIQNVPIEDFLAKVQECQVLTGIQPWLESIRAGLSSLTDVSSLLALSKALPTEIGELRADLSHPIG